MKLQSACRVTRCAWNDSELKNFLSSRIWTIPKVVELPIDFVPHYERIAKSVTKMAKASASNPVIAHVLQVSPTTVAEALRFAKTGKRPATKPSGNSTEARRTVQVHRHRCRGC